MTTAAVELTNHAYASDAVLLALVPSDPAAMAELARRYAGYVHAIARRQTGDAHLADDITQAVFLVLWRKASRIRPQALASWLHQTTRYAAANANRAVRRRNHHEQKAAQTEAAMSYSNCDSDSFQSVLDDAIASLPRAERQLVIDRYLRHVDLSTLSIGLGITPAATQKRIERALSRLRGLLERRARVAGSVAVTPSLVVAVLAAAGPSQASASLIYAITRPSAISSASTIAKGTIAMLAWKKAVIASSLLGTILIGAAGVSAVRRAVIQTPISTPPVDNKPLAVIKERTPSKSIVGELKSGPRVELIGLSGTLTHEWPVIGFDGTRLDGKPLDSRFLIYDQMRSVRDYVINIHENAKSGKANVQLDAWSPDANTTIKWPMTFPYTDEVKRLAPDGYVIHADDIAGRPATLRFAVATGPWSVQLSSRADASVTGVIANTRHVISKTFETGGLASMDYQTIPFPPSEPALPPVCVRFVAIDTAGREHRLLVHGLNYFTDPEIAAVPALGIRIPDVRFEATPFKDAIETIKRTFGVPIEVDWATLAADGYNPEQPVTLRRQNTRAADVLAAVISQNTNADYSPLRKQLDNGMVRVLSLPKGGEFSQTMSAIDLPLSRLARFEVQTRAFNEWIEFSNVTATPGEVRPATVRTSDDAPKPFVGPLRAGLPNGPAIELLGVADNSAGPGKRWWNLDGSPLADPPYESIPNRLAIDAIEIPFRVFGTDPQGRPWQAAGMQWRASGLTVGLASRGRYVKGQPHELVLLCQPREQEKADIQFRFIDAPNQTWLTLDSTEPGASVQGDVPGLGACSLTVADERDDKAVVAVNLPAPDESTTVTVSAVGRDGNPIYSNVGRLKGNVEVGFNVPLSRIASFKLNVSTFSRWMTFRDVALRPGIKTSPATEAGDARQIK